MDPPSYEEATWHQLPNFHAPASPFYQVSFVRPPPYEGTRIAQPDPFSVLRTPTVRTTYTSQVSSHQSTVVTLQPDPFPVLRTSTVTSNNTSRVFIHQPVAAITANLHVATSQSSSRLCSRRHGDVQRRLLYTLMDPPTYDEATSPSSAVAVEGCDVCPPPSYYASISHSVNPPPYQETNPFPVLMPTIFSPPQTSPVSIHLTPLEAVVSQPASEQTLAMANLLGSPGNVQCPHCRRDVVTNIKQMPGKGAFTLCCILAFSGLVCGFCLVPFMIPDLWDVHHYCPHCGKHLHVHHKS